jgi:hypothetical protein
MIIVSSSGGGGGGGGSSSSILKSNSASVSNYRPTFILNNFPNYLNLLFITMFHIS